MRRLLLLLNVHSKMPAEVGTLGEGLFAGIADKRLFPGVDSDVDIEIALLTKRLRAVWAAKMSLSGG